MYAQLIVDLFAFQAPYLRNADLPKAIQQMYKVGSYYLNDKLFCRLLFIISLLSLYRVL